MFASLVQRLKQIHPHYWLILVVGLFTHGLVLLNDGMYMDSLTRVYLPIEEGDWSRLYRIYDDFGYPIRAYLHWAASSLGGVILGHKLVTFLSLLLWGLFLYQVLWQSRAFSRPQALLISLLTLTYPAYQVAIDLIMMPYSLAYAAFVIGLWLQLQADQTNGREHWLWRAAALATLAFSFWIYSLLAFYFGFLLLFALVYAQAHTGMAWLRSVWQYSLRHADYIALPFAFWGVLQLYFRPIEKYQAGLQDNMAYALGQFAHNGILLQFEAALSPILASPLWLLLAILAFLLAYQRLKQPETAIESPFAERRWPQLLVALTLLGLAMLPYIISNNIIINAQGWSTRHAMLMGLPIAVLLVWPLGFLEASLRSYWTALLLVLVGVFSVALVNHYMQWQARWVKDQAIMHYLEAHPDYQDVSIFWIDDQFPLGGEVLYRPQEWSGYFHLAWGGESAVGLSYRYPIRLVSLLGEDQNRRYYDYLRDLDIAGCQALLQIRRGPEPASFNDAWGLSLRYWAFKYLPGANLDTYLTNLVEIRIRRMLAPQAVQCRAQTAYLEAYPSAALSPTDQWVDHLLYLNVVLRLEQASQANDVPILENTTDLELQTRLLEQTAAQDLSAEQTRTLAELGFDVALYRRYQAIQALVPNP